MQLELKPTNKPRPKTLVRGELTYKLTPLLHVRAGLRLTPQMRLAINLLQMPLVKLQEYVKQQVEENPLLEIDPHTNCNIPEVNPTIGVGVENKEAPLKETEFDLNPVRNTIEDTKNSKISNGVNYGSNEDEPRPFLKERGEEEKQNYRESLITKSATLSDHLLNQLHLLVNSDEECKIGEVIIANIDGNGYLRSSIEEIAKSTEGTPQEVQKVLSLIQTFDPVGVCARDLRECLLLQIKAKGEENSLVGQIIDRYLPYLEKKRFEFIAKKLKVPVGRIKEAIKEIANLEPKPGRSFNTERAVRLIPDAILKRNNDKYEVMFNDWELPHLALNPKYKRMLKQEDIAEETKEYLKERLKAAKFLINALNKRKETIRKVTEAIVYIQKDFLDNGMQNLKPMTLSQIAKLVGKHKSTVSRTVSNKYLQTPDGIFELRHFLNSGVKQENGVLFSSKAIKSRMKELIENENKEKPLTDQQVANHFKQEGISISRRTIAKYRNRLKIIPSQSRRE